MAISWSFEENLDTELDKKIQFDALGAAYLQVGYAIKREQVACASRTKFMINPISNRNTTIPTSRMTQQSVVLHNSPRQDRRERADVVVGHETVYIGGDELCSMLTSQQSYCFVGPPSTADA